MTGGRRESDVDFARGLRDTRPVRRTLRPGNTQVRLARRLNAAYAEGLVSEDTLHHRLDLLLGSRVIDPAALVGDLSRRSARRAWLDRTVRQLGPRVLRRGSAEPPVLLALDWSGGGAERLLIGRHPECDVVLSRPRVSRRHARLVFRDGGWIVQDLDSTNGTTVNGATVGRCRLSPGDLIVFGDQAVRVD
jgi:FHA domain